MSKDLFVFAEGDWIVHLYHGVGQIQTIESKCLDGKTCNYYKVITQDSTFWVPVEETENNRIRPLSSPREFKQALRILKRNPRQMNPDHSARKERIKEVMAGGDLRAIARLVRDMAARQAEARLNDSEERAFNRFLDRFLAEWSACSGITREEARLKLMGIFQELHI